MTPHYSKFLLNVYANTPYFQAHIPANYPLMETLQRCKAYRKLPTRLRQLSDLSRQWGELHLKWPPYSNTIGDYYDREGYELDHTSGRPLTLAEIQSQWEPNPSVDSMTVRDIPLPRGGFPNPATWEAPKTDETVHPDDVPTEEDLRRDIKLGGREAVSQTYGIPMSKLPN